MHHLKLCYFLMKKDNTMICGVLLNHCLTVNRIISKSVCLDTRLRDTSLKRCGVKSQFTNSVSCVSIIGVDASLTTTTKRWRNAAVTAGSVGIASLASVVALPVGLVLEGVAIGLGGAAMAIKYTQYKITQKLKKHDEIRVIAESKLNSIGNHVSKAIEDGCISQEEFVFISEERNKYSETNEK